MNRLRDIMSNGLNRALVLSLLAHALIAAALLVTLPLPETDPATEEQVVEITLVPPPEPDQPEAEQPAAEEQAAAQPEPQAAEEPAIEEPAAEDPAAEEPPAEPEAVEPPAPEPPAAEPEPESAAPEPEPEAEQPAPEPEQAAPPADQAGADQPGANELGEGEAAAIPVLRPVFQFGEEDSGPREALDGDSSTESGQPDPSEGDAAPSASDQAQPEETRPTEQQQAAAAAEEAAAEAEALPPDASVSETSDQPAPDPSTPDQPVTETPGIALPEITLPDAQLAARALSDADSTAAPPAPSDLPGVALAPAPSVAPDAPSSSETPATGLPQGDLAEAGNLFSPDLTENRVAMTAMGSLPRQLRASQLCTTELREQLRNGSTRYGVELLPSYQLESGTILAVPDAAFRADGDWYNLSFRCTVDADALKVVSFALKVGTPIPRTEWKARGFPEF